MFRKLFLYLLGGRPMINIGEYFIYKAPNKIVYLYIDRLGRFWMAYNKWSSFRVESNMNCSTKDDIERF